MPATLSGKAKDATAPPKPASKVRGSVAAVLQPRSPPHNQPKRLKGSGGGGGEWKVKSSAAAAVLASVEPPVVAPPGLPSVAGQLHAVELLWLKI